MKRWLFESEAHLLYTLLKEDKACSIADLGRKIGKTYQNAFITAKSLKSLGLIDVVKIGRANDITLTEKGRIGAQKVSEIYEVLPEL